MMSSPPLGAVPTRIILRKSDGRLSAICCATMPPRENPSTSQVLSPRPSRNDRAGVAISRIVSGTLPDDRPSPAFSNRITSRSHASGSVTAGSQLSSVPVKCWRHSSGSFDPEPKRRYAYRSFPTWINRVGVVTMLGPFLVDMELTPTQDLQLQSGGEYSLQFLTEHEAAEVMRLPPAPKLYQSMDLNACAKPALL